MNNTAQERTLQSLQRWELSAWLDHESASAFGAPWNAPWTWVLGTSAAIPIQPDHLFHTVPPSGASRTMGLLQSCCEKRRWHCFVLPQAAAREALLISCHSSLCCILATLLAWSIGLPTTLTPGALHICCLLWLKFPLVHWTSAPSTCLLERSPDSKSCRLLLPPLFLVGKSLKCVSDAHWSPSSSSPYL